MATTNEELLKQQAATGTQPSRTDQINALYDAQKEAQLNELKGAYEQNLSNAQAARDKLPGQYQQSQNDLATQYERNRLNLNRQFSANGINTGAASQAQLSRSNEYLRDFGKLKAAENQAIADADRGINDLTAAYNRNVASAGASVEASRTGALLDEGARQQQQDLNKAQLLAGYGDFSGFAALYGDNVANNMLAIWKAQNPDLAYRTGQMTPQEYYNMTGKWPAGYNAPSAWKPSELEDVEPELSEDGKTGVTSKGTVFTVQGRDYTNPGLSTAQVASLQELYRLPITGRTDPVTSMMINYAAQEADRAAASQNREQIEAAKAAAKWRDEEQRYAEMWASIFG